MAVRRRRLDRRAAALIGIAFESIGDAQLDAFRKNPASTGKVLDTGLWRYARAIPIISATR